MLINYNVVQPNYLQNYPFTSKHIIKFKRELFRAGDFDSLMRKKLALKQEQDKPLITRYDNIEGYKMKFLIGVYATLRPYYNTEIPYVFWSKLYELLQKGGTANR